MKTELQIPGSWDTIRSFIDGAGRTELTLGLVRNTEHDESRFLIVTEFCEKNTEYMVAVGDHYTIDPIEIENPPISIISCNDNKHLFSVNCKDSITSHCCDKSTVEMHLFKIAMDI